MRNSGVSAGTGYFKDEPVSAVGCAIQYEYCAPPSPGSRNKRCETPHGFADERETWNETLGERTKEQYQSLTSLFEQNIGALDQLALTIRSSVLVARSSLQASIQGILPNDQWQIEMENLVNTYLAKMQREIILRITGPPFAPADPNWWQQVKKNDTGKWAICKSQVRWSCMFWALDFTN